MSEAGETILVVIDIIHLLAIVGITIYVLVKMYRRAELCREPTPDYDWPKIVIYKEKLSTKYWSITTQIEAWAWIDLILLLTFIYTIF